MTRLLARASTIFLLALVAACAAPVRPPAADAYPLWELRQAQLVKLENWDLRGRLAVRMEEEGGQLGLRWRRQDGHQQMDLSGPLGKGVFQLTEDSAGARARDAEGRVYRAADMEALLFSLTGWRIPVGALQYWVRGLPAPGTLVVPALDDAGRARELEQLGWRVRFVDYVRAGGVDLPRRLFLRGSLPDQANASVAEVELRLVVDRWGVP